MALNIKPLFPREQIILIPTPKASDTMDANTKTDPDDHEGAAFRLRPSRPAPKGEKTPVKKRLWVWGVY